MRHILTLTIGLVLVLIGCQTAEPPPHNAQPTDPTQTSVPADTLDHELLVDDIGTIEYQDLEGGFYGIVTDDGEHYNPVELDDEYKEDGLRVRFRGYINEEVATIHMWGQNIDILEIMALDVQY